MRYPPRERGQSSGAGASAGDDHVGADGGSPCESVRESRRLEGADARAKGCE